MPDQPYKNWPFIFESLGIVARKVEDQTDPHEWLNEDSIEELAEGGLGQRLGSVVVNCAGALGGAVFPLSAKVVTCGKLNGLFGSTWRYAVTADGGLWRRSGLTPGAYTKISSSFSGNPIYMVPFVPAVASAPWQYFADASGMWKDNGTLAAPLPMGIFQPQYPITAQSQDPDEIILDPMRSSSYTTSGIGSFSPNSVENSTNTSAAITATGIQAVPVNGGAGVSWLGLFQSLVIDTGGNEETVLVIGLTATGFIANFTKVHANGVTVDEYGWSGTVAASATGTVSRAFSGTPISAWPLILSQSDYIGVWIYVSDPTQVQSIQLAFTLADGSSFYKVVAQGPLQNLLTTASTNSTAAATAATDAILSESLGLYGNSASSIGELNAGGGWTPLLFQLSDFASTGNADFDALFDNWANVTGYTVTIIANDNAAPVLIEMSSLVLFGGAGPDTFAGVAYDYLFTFYNDNDGTESNPCMVMTNVNPPNSTNWVYPRRQPVLLTMNLKTYAQAGQLQDGQITAIRIYRRGGTLGDNYRRVDEIPVNIAAGGTVQYTDTTSDEDLAASDFISFTNDVPVTSSLPNPVNNTLGVAINTTNQVATITLATGYPAFSSPISVRQQVTLGSPTNIANNFETVIVLTLILTGPPLNKSVTGFTAFVQNTHAIGEQVQATEKIGQPVSGICIAFGQAWFWGDPLNPSTLYWSAKGNPQAVSSAANIDTGSPDDPLTAVVGFAGNLYISAPKAGWQSVAPGSNANASPTIYPTKCKHGCVADFGFVATEEGIYYQGVDGLRFFAGGASQYLTQNLEFIFQSVGVTPIVEADPTRLSQTIIQYWNMMILCSYIGVDGSRHRLILHSVYKRWRNDDVDAQAMFLEVDTNDLVYGDSNGLVHIDRQNLGYDQGSVGGVLAQVPIAINLQTSYQNQGLPANQKQYQNLQLDAATAGQPLTITLLFNDGQQSIVLGTVTTAQRAKVNLPINSGDGQQAYKASLQITGNLTQQIAIYQASLEALPLPITRRAFDSFKMNLSAPDSKIAKDIFWIYSAAAPIVVSVYYDDSPTVGFTFTMPTAGGIRNPLRQRLPAVSFRTIRFVGLSTADFMLWPDSCLWHKMQCQGRGYEKALFVEN